MIRVGVNKFVRRQTSGSPYSHYTGTFEQVAELAERSVNLAEAKPGYRDGVLLCPVDPKGFFCGTVAVSEDTHVSAKLVKRQEGELPYLQVYARGPKLPAEAVDLVIYRQDVLRESGDEVSTDCEWELVSINARPTLEPEPMTPVAMARNFLGLNGGTRGDYSAKQFAEAILYWSTRAMVDPAGSDEGPNAEEVDLAHRGRYLDAVKSVRDRTRLTLFDAKKLMDSWRATGKLP